MRQQQQSSRRLQHWTAATRWVEQCSAGKQGCAGSLVVGEAGWVQLHAQKGTSKCGNVMHGVQPWQLSTAW